MMNLDNLQAYAFSSTTIEPELSEAIWNTPDLVVMEQVQQSLRRELEQLCKREQLRLMSPEYDTSVDYALTKERIKILYTQRTEEIHHHTVCLSYWDTIPEELTHEISQPITGLSPTIVIVDELEDYLD